MIRPLNAQALIGLALLALASGAAAQHSTLIQVEVDFMDNGLHSHRPQQAEIDALVQMFACHGITLVFLLDEAIPETTIIACLDPEEDDFFTCTGPNSFSFLKARYKQQGPGWHYCIFGHAYDAGDGIGSSGIAEGGGDDFIVTLGTWQNLIGSPWDRAATFAHELGHNLGLAHWAPNTPVLGRGPYAPNYASVMSYQYQLRGVRSRLECLGLVDDDHLFKELDYSNGRMPPLREFSMSEPLGAGVHRVDWNCDGLYTGTALFKDVDEQDDWCFAGGGVGTVYDYDDWSNIVSSADDPDVYLDRRRLPVYTCASYEELELLDAGSCPVPQPIVAPEPCVSAQMVWVDPQHSGSSVGTGELPFTYLDLALFGSPTGSIFYLQPGVQKLLAPGPLLIKERAILAGPGGAVIDP